MGMDESRGQPLEPTGLSEFEDPALDELRTPVWLRRAFLCLAMSFMLGLGSIATIMVSAMLAQPGLAFASGLFSFSATGMAVGAMTAGSLAAAEGGPLNAALGLFTIVAALVQGLFWAGIVYAWLMFLLFLLLDQL